MMQLTTDFDDFGDAFPQARTAISLGIRAVLDVIERNYAAPVTLTDLAAICSLSLHRFVTVFGMQVGIPPPQLRPDHPPI